MAFDPNKPFEVEEESTEFDPNQAFEVEGAENQPEVTQTSEAPIEAAAEAALADQPVPTVDEPSQLEALGLGTASGVTLDFADEIGGGIAAIGAQLGGSEETIPESYRKYRDIIRNRMGKAREAHEGTYLAGEIGSAFIPGLGAIGALGKAAKGTSVAAKAIQAAKTGAAVGGLAGLGTSQADLTKGEIGQAAQDTASGAALGAGFGGVLGGGVALAGKASGSLKAPLEKLVKNDPLLGDIVLARQLGKKGKAISGLAADTRRAQKLALGTKEVQDIIFKKLDDNFNAKMKLFEGRPNEKINFTELYKNTINQLDDMVVNSGLDVAEAEKLKTVLRAKFYQKLPKTIKGAGKTKIRDKIDPQTGEPIGRTTTVTGKQLDPDFVPGEVRTQRSASVTESPIGEAVGITKTVDEVVDAVSPGVFKGDMSLEDAARFVRGYQETGSKLFKSDPIKSGILKQTAGKASDIIENAVPATANLNKQSTNAYKILEEFPDIDPANKKVLSKSLGKFIEGLENTYDVGQDFSERTVKRLLRQGFGSDEAQKIIKKMRDVSKEYALGRRVGSGGEQISLMSQLIGAIKNRLVKGANIVGRVERKFTKNSSLTTKTIKNLSDDGIEKTAAQLEQKGNQKTADKLRLMLGSQNQSKRNAVIYMLAQNPDYRQQIGEVLEESEKDLNEETETNPATERPDEIANERRTSKDIKKAR